jgi:transposase
MRLESLIRKSLKLQVHKVISVKRGKDGILEAQIGLKGRRKPRCGCCGRKAIGTRGRMRARRWRDLFVLSEPLEIAYSPYRVECEHCGVRVERVEWAGKWIRVTRPLACAVACMARKQNWQEVARHFRLGWKTVVAVVRWAVKWGLRKRKLKTLHYLGMDEVSRTKGHRYMSLFYDLERKMLLKVTQNRTLESAKAFFRWLGKRRSGSIRAVCMDMWKPYLEAVREGAKKAKVVFDRFHLVVHLNNAVDLVRREMWHGMKGPKKEAFKKTRYLWLKKPSNLKEDERLRLNILLRENLPVVRAYLLKESFQKFWNYNMKGPARKYLRKWFWMATHSRLKPMRDFAYLVRRHEEGIIAWIDLGISNGALEGMANKIKTTAKRAYGFRTPEHYELAIYHSCANLPLPTGG